jgi:hypothetical protein
VSPAATWPCARASDSDSKTRAAAMTRARAILQAHRCARKPRVAMVSLVVRVCACGCGATQCAVHRVTDCLTRAAFRVSRAVPARGVSGCACRDAPWGGPADVCRASVDASTRGPVAAAEVRATPALLVAVAPPCRCDAAGFVLLPPTRPRRLTVLCPAPCNATSTMLLRT